MIKIKANKKLELAPRNIRCQELKEKKQKNKEMAIKEKAMMYQDLPRSGVWYSGTCHFKDFKLFSAIFLFDKGFDILYSDYTIKLKIIGAVSKWQDLLAWWRQITKVSEIQNK